MGAKAPMNDKAVEERRMTYGTGKLFLQEGYYTTAELKAFVAFMARMDRANRRSMRKTK